MIVIEGPDGSGKTTLAKELCGRYVLQYRRPPKVALTSEAGPGEGTALIDWWLAQIEADRKWQKLGVYDRTTFISDPIYRLATGTKPQGTTPEMTTGIFHLVNYGLVIFCLPPWEQARAVLDDELRPKLEGVDWDRLEIIHWAYECQYDIWKEAAYSAVFRYDWTNRNDIYKEVEAYLGPAIDAR